MPRIGITGHIWLTPGTDQLVFDSVVGALHSFAGPELHGVTCLAQGADQIFARAVLAMRGTFEVILPASDYRERVVEPENLPCFDDLLDRAVAVEKLPFARADPSAYAAAGLAVLDRCDLLLAVWDGQPSQRPGDTADVVAHARRRRIPVTVLWPVGADRQ